MEANVRTKARGTLSAVVTRADGTVEHLGVIASTEDATLTAGAAPPGLLRQLKAAWVEGWHQGTDKKANGE